MEIRVNKLALLALALIILGVILRVVPHTANFAPIGAIALFAGAVMNRRYALWLPLVIMIASDLIIGLHPLIMYTWGAFLLIGLFGTSLRGKPNWFRVPVGSLSASLIFFVVSNFGVWIEGRLYPATWQGLGDCFLRALPFWRSTLVSDLSFSVLFFGLYAVASHRLTGSLTLRLTPAKQKAGA